MSLAPHSTLTSLPWLRIQLTVFIIVLCSARYLSVIDVPEVWFPDDFFYFAKIAINFWETGSFTFDFLTKTNGFQPLWQLVMIALAFPFVVIGVPSAMPYGVAVLGILLAIWSGHILLAILIRAGLRPQNAYLVTILAAFCFVSRLLSGMATTMIGVMVGLTILYVQKTLQDSTRVSSVRLGLLTGLVILTRLDHGVFALMAYLVISRYLSLRSVVRAGLVVCLLLAPYFAQNLVIHGHIVPISGRVKDSWGDLEERIELGKALEGPGDIARALHEPIVQERLRRPLSWLDDELLPGKRISDQLRHESLPSFVQLTPTFVRYGLPLVGLLFCLVMWKRSRDRARRATIELCLCILLFLLWQLIFYSTSGYHFWMWYYTLGIVAFSVLASLPLGLAFSFVPQRWVTALLVVLTLLVGAIGARRGNEQYSQRRDSHYLTYSDVADWFSENTPPDTIIGGWPVGTVGFRAQRRVVNLEGLVSDQQMLEANRRVNLLPQFAKLDVSYVTMPSLVSDDFLSSSLQWPSVIDGDWIQRHYGELDAYRALILRAFLDAPEVFSTVAVFPHPDVSSHVFKVDRTRLERLLANNVRNLTQLNSVAYVIQAEDAAVYHDARAQVLLPNARGLSISGRNLQYRLDDLAVSEYVVFLRFAQLTDLPVSLTVQPAKQVVELNGRSVFGVSRVTKSPVKLHDKMTLSLEFGDGYEGLFVDELHLVRVGRVGAYSAWVDSIRSPESIRADNHEDLESESKKRGRGK